MHGNLRTCGGEIFLYARKRLCSTGGTMSFPTTQWTLLAIATMNGDETSREAMEELCRIYRAPVFHFFRKHLDDPADAEDLTQELLSKLTQSRIWRRGDADLGRFRTYLLAIATNALRTRLSDRRRAGVQKSLDELLDLGADFASPGAGEQEEFDRHWATAAVTAAWRAVQTRAEVRPETARRFAVLRRFLPGSAKPISNEEAAELLGLDHGNLRTLVHRLRRDFRDALRSAIAATIPPEADLDEEMAYLSGIMSRSAFRSGPDEEILQQNAGN